MGKNYSKRNEVVFQEKLAERERGKADADGRLVMRIRGLNAGTRLMWLVL